MGLSKAVETLVKKIISKVPFVSVLGITKDVQEWGGDYDYILAFRQLEVYVQGGPFDGV